MYVHNIAIYIRTPTRLHYPARLRSLARAGNKLLKLNSFNYKDPDTHAALKVLHLLYYNPASAWLTIGLLMFNALIQLKIMFLEAVMM